jgi:hypothetical protein
LTVATDFRCNDDLIPGQEFETFAENSFRFGIPVEWGGVEEIDASIEGCLD